MQRHLIPRHALWLLLVIATAMTLLGGCAHSTFGTRTPLDVSGPVSVDIATFGGDVTIRSTGDAPGQAYVLVRPEATHSVHRMTDAQTSLEDIDWSIETVEEDGHTTIRIRGTTLYPESGLQRLHVTIATPYIDGVRARTRLGDVDVLDVDGPIDIDTTRGDVSIVTDRSLHGPITAMTTDGDITIRAAPGTRGRLDGFTAKGRVICSVPDGKLRVHGRSGDQTLQGVINDGDEPFTLRTNDGTIRVVVKQYPYQQSSFLYD